MTGHNVQVLVPLELQNETYRIYKYVPKGTLVQHGYTRQPTMVNSRIQPSFTESKVYTSVSVCIINDLGTRKQ